jgi:hypothetical protein
MDIKELVGVLRSPVVEAFRTLGEEASLRVPYAIVLLSGSAGGLSSYAARSKALETVEHECIVANYGNAVLKR